MTVVLNQTKSDYPFGMVMPGRNWTAASADGHRFGFNGKESDDEIKGESNSLDFLTRIYDSRLGRFLSVDEQSASYPFISQFNFSANNPIRLIDVDGKGPGAPSQPNKNLFIIIKSDDEIQLDYYTTLETSMGSYHIILSNDIEQAYSEAAKYLGDTKAENIVVDMHGVTYVTTNPDNSTTDTPDNRALLTSPNESQPANRIDQKEIENYLLNKQANNTLGQNNDVKALEGLFGLVQDGGNFVFGTCKTGDDIGIMSACADLAGCRINLYFNKDSTPIIIMGGQVQIWTGKTPLSVQSEGDAHIKIDEGWTKITTGDAYIDLINLKGNSGSIFLDSRENQEAVQVDKKN